MTRTLSALCPKPECCSDLLGPVTGCASREKHGQVKQGIRREHLPKSCSSFYVLTVVMQVKPLLAGYVRGPRLDSSAGKWHKPRPLLH